MEPEHPAGPALEAFAAEELAAGDRAVVASHLVSCAACQATVEEWRALLTQLAELPDFAPSAAFPDRVMARVTVPVPLADRARAMVAQAGRALERMLPKTTRGWAVATAFLALPVVVIAGVLAWLLSRPYVTAGDLWVFVSQNVGAGIASTGAWLFQRLVENDATVWLLRAVGDVVAAGGTSGVGMAAAALGAGMAASIWVLYTNLFRAPRRDPNYVTYSF